MMNIKKSVKSIFYAAAGRVDKRRKFIDSELGVSGFLRVMKEEDVNYVVLRWFDPLPYVEPGEDIDILVADDDVEIMTSYMKVAGRKGDIPCDVYSVSGLPGSSSRNMPYYPVPIAKKILDNAVWVNDIVRAPSPDHHFLSLCYHVVYHKGYSSGVPSEDVERGRKVIPCKDHDYVGTLEKLGRESTLSLENLDITLEGLDRVLRDAGWKPAHDTLEKLSIKNQWLGDVLYSEGIDVPVYLRGVSVFLVREEGMNHLGDIKRILFDQGFDHVLEGKIPLDRVSQAVSGIRGGNWGKGPWPKSGGLPAYFYIVYDAKPLQPDDETAREHPGLDNQRISMAKKRIRDNYNRRVEPQARCNIVHSADNACQAISYINIVNPESVSLVEHEARRKFSGFLTPFEVVADFSKHARRAKVELISFHGDKAICKTFKEGRERYLNREIMARKVGKELSEVSAILESGKNYIVIEYVEGGVGNSSRFRPLFHGNSYLPVWIVERMKEIIIYYRSRGYECIDLSPRNIIYDPVKGFKIIDFEFFQKVGSASDALNGNFAWYSVPEGFEGDLPQWKSNDSLYRRRWFRYTGIPLYFCINNHPKAVLHLVRGITFLCFSLNNARKKAFSLPVRKIRSLRLVAASRR
jgi:hypothetical protein